MQHFGLPLPPYQYRRIRAFAFMFQDESACWIAGSFPEAPTGPFREVWKLARTSSGWRPELIVVDNQVRMEAGRIFWRLPKVLGKVALGFESYEHSVAFTDREAEPQLMVFRHTGRRVSRFSDGNFLLNLASGHVANLKFNPIKSATPCVVTAHDSAQCGHLLEFSGEAELSSPILSARAA